MFDFITGYSAVIHINRAALFVHNLRMTALADIWQLRELVLISRRLSVLQKRLVIDSGVTPALIVKKFF